MGKIPVISNDLGPDGTGYMTVEKKVERCGGTRRYAIRKHWRADRPHSLTPAPTINSIPIFAYPKLAKFKLAHDINHFEMKTKVYLTAVMVAYHELSRTKQIEVVYKTAEIELQIIELFELINYHKQQS